MIVYGIDPGWASCGLAVYDKGEIASYGNFVPRDEGQTDSYIAKIDYVHCFAETISRKIKDFDAVYMERFVAYGGVQTQVNEDILMFIGAIKGFFDSRKVKVNMVRAIDWKPKVCKYLVRTKGFNNPYPSFDKKYSILAAKTLSGLDIKSDHAADAVCLSYLGEIEKYNKENKK